MEERPANSWQYLGVSKNSGTLKWMVKIMVPNPMNKWMIWGNVEVTLAMWVSIQDLKKPLNTEFSIGPKSVTIMIPGCQYKNSVPKLRQFFQITNNSQNYHYIYI